MDIPDRFKTWNFFLPEKKCFDTFRWVSPFSIIVLWSQSSGFEPNFPNQVRKADFGGTIPGRLATLENHQKWPKMAPFGAIPLQRGSNGANSYKFWLTGVLRHLEAKSIKKFQISIFHISRSFFKKNFRKAKNHLFWAQILGWMDFP